MRDVNATYKWLAQNPEIITRWQSFLSSAGSFTLGVYGQWEQYPSWVAILAMKMEWERRRKNLL